MTEFKKISELELVTTIGDNDRLIVETATGTKAVTKAAFKEEAQTITKADIGLGNVDNTSDANKPISTAMQTALDSKVATTTFSNAINNLANLYLAQETADNEYLKKNTASGTYLSKTDASTFYVSKEDFNSALAGLETILASI